jgi:hypothetical protein
MLDFRKYNFGLSITILFFISDITMAQYCIDQSNYTQWLCNNVKGAQQACSAPRFVGNFPNLSACETARKDTLPNDFRWQSMTKCVECGPSIPSFKQPHPARENLNQKNLEEERLTEKIRQEAERTGSRKNGRSKKRIFKRFTSEKR